MRRIYLNEYNVLMENATYLPLSTGLLRAFAESQPSLKEHYAFMPFIFHMDDFDTILAKYTEEPDIAAFSVAMWNEQLTLAVAKAIKERYPNCLIVLGGPQAPHVPQAYFDQNPFVDIVVKGEGEEAFADILQARLDGVDYDTVPGIVWRDPDTGQSRAHAEKRPFDRDMDQYPSPYLNGLYEDLIAAYPDMNFQAIVETNRGCPFQCTFCYWGKGGLSRKYRYHTMERVEAEIEWCARHRIKYVFNADSNFGMHKRDMDIANFIVETKKKYGYPEKFRTCYGKNTDEKIFAIGKLFHQHQLEKGITLSRQSNEPLVQENIKRQNIHLDTYQNLQVLFNQEKIPIYSEMILGLPGETLESWTRGVTDLLRSGLKNQLFIYTLQVYPNTDLGNADYQEKFGLILQDMELNEIHGAIRPKSWVREVETIVVGSNAMSTEEWRDGLIFSWTTMLLHSLKIGFFMLFYMADRLQVDYRDFLLYLSRAQMPEGQGAMLREQLEFFGAKVDEMLRGGGRGCILPEAGNIYWDVEEMAFLHICGDLERFYDQLLEVVLTYLNDRNVVHDPDEVAEMMVYQRMKIPTPETPAIQQWTFQRSFPEYFDSMFQEDRTPLEDRPQRLRVEQEDFAGSLGAYAKTTILFGRKSDLLICLSAWSDA